MALLAAVILGAGSGAWYVLQKPAPKAPTPIAVPQPTEAAVAAVPTTPQYPVEAISPPPAADSPLPDLFDSDAYVRDALVALFAQPKLAQWLVPEHLVQRFVAFVDALPNRKVSTNLWPAKPASGRFFVQERDAGTVIGPANSARYDAHVATLVGVDTGAAVAVYLRLYPLLQQAYRELGYPDRHFNDRFVAVLDHLLAAPEPVAPVAVKMDDKGNWIYADADLESASAGQKFLMRLGATHEAAVKARLHEFRAALAGARP
jgi:hypothetical protein